MAEPFLTPERFEAIRNGTAPTGDEEKAIALHGGKYGAPRDGSQAYRPRVLYGKRRTFWPRGDAAAARIFRIMQGCTKSTSLEQAVHGAQYKRLAQAYAETWVYYMTRSKPPPVTGNDHNPFRRLSDIDAERMFIRKVEDICDLSTGVLGSWWTK